MSKEFYLFLKDFKTLMTAYGVCLFKDDWYHFNEESCNEEHNEIIKISGCDQCISIEELYERLNNI